MVTGMKLGLSITGVPAGGHYKVAVQEMDYCFFFFCVHICLFFSFFLSQESMAYGGELGMNVTAHQTSSVL